ncbi:hypothetical protein IFM89_007359, partial [Coptis chinensis]
MTAVGPGLTGRSVGDVVAYGGNPMDPIVGASVMLKGMAAWFLLRQCFKEKAANARTLPPNTIRWVIRPSGTIVTFSKMLAYQ